MSLELHSNDCSREAKPSLWIFTGQSIALLPLSVLAGICIVRVLSAFYVDWWLAILIGCIPLAGSVIIVHFFINARPPSFFWDLALLVSWRFRTWLYMHGCLECPPCLWTPAPKHSHPKEYYAC